MLFESGVEGLGEPFDVSAARGVLVTRLLQRVGLNRNAGIDGEADA